MSRTAEVKQRLGPIMERMKSSLAQIQSIEESLASNRVGLDVPQSGTDPSGSNEDRATNASASTARSQKSRQLLKESMGMLKTKLSTLQKMEDALTLSEDRRQNLQHLFLQSSLSKPILEQASNKRKNEELEKQLANLTIENRRLDEKCRTVNSLEQKIEELTKQTRKLSETEDKLHHAQTQNKIFERDLHDRQSKINELSIRGDDLECQVEELKLLCDSLRNELHNAARRPDSVEMGKGRQGADGNAKSQNSGASLSSTSETDIDSSSFLSSWEGDSVNQRSTNERYDEAQRTPDSSLQSTASQDGLLHLLEVVDMSKLSQIDDDELSSILPEGPSVAMVQKLLAKIETVEKENEELRRLHQASSERLCGLAEENTDQASRLRALENCKIGPEQAVAKHGRGSFFGFLKSDAPQSKRNAKVEKARLIGESLAGQSRGKE